MSKDKKNTQLQCPLCKHIYWADIAGLPDSTIESSETEIPYTCPVCNHKNAKVLK